MATTMIAQPTASQFASAITHLERRDEWRTVRIDGTRYISLVSGRSNRVYLARADAAGCSCVWSQTMSSPCSHRIAIELAALEDELREGYVVGSATVAKAFKTYAELMPAECDDRFCTDDALPREPGDEGRYCKRHQLVSAF